jgi:hypothetical protein
MAGRFRDLIEESRAPTSLVFPNGDISPEQQNCDRGVLLILLSALHVVLPVRT